MRLSTVIRDNRTHEYHLPGEEVKVLKSIDDGVDPTNKRKLITVEFMNGQLGYLYLEDLKE